MPSAWGVTLRRALIVAPYFPPRRRVGSLRPFRFASHLQRFGWRPLVVCFATPGESLSERERQRAQGIERIELRTPFDRTRQGASGELGQAARSRPGRQAPSAGERLGGDAARALSWLASALDASVPIDAWAPLLGWHAATLLPRLVRAAPEVVFSTADPWSSHLFAACVARGVGVPWVADFRDPWTLCPFRGRGPRLTRVINRAFERHVLMHASHATFTSERTLERYRAAYPAAARRMSCLPNGFDASLLTDPLDEPLEPLAATAPLRLLFFGRFRPLSPARAILLALARLLEREPGARGRVRQHPEGSLPPEDAPHARTLGVADAFEPLSPVPPERTLSAVRRHDISLLSTAPERDDIIPAKLWDYLAARRPILALGRNPDVARLLSTCSAGVQLAPERTADIAELLARCLAHKQRGTPLPLPTRPLDHDISAFEAQHQTRCLAQLFDALTAAPSFSAARLSAVTEACDARAPGL